MRLKEINPVQNCGKKNKGGFVSNTNNKTQHAILLLRKIPQFPQQVWVVFRNEIMATCKPASLAKRPKCRSNSYFWIHELRNKDNFKQKL